MTFVTDDNKEFETMEEMHEYYKSQEPWYEKAWDFVYLPVYRFFYHQIWDKIRPGNSNIIIKEHDTDIHIKIVGQLIII